MRARAQSVPDEVFTVDEPASQATLGSWASERPQQRSRAKRVAPRTPDALFDLAREQVAEMMASGDWGEAIPRHFVALYAVMHKHVYGVEATELTTTARTCAAGAASRMLNRDFHGDRMEMASFMRWCWERAAWRRKHRNDDEFRIGWRYQFQGSMVTDYRMAAERARRGGR